MTKLIINTQTGKETLRELNAKEIAQQETDIANEIAEQELYVAKNADKVSAKAAILERLGLTEDEAKLLLG